MFKIKMKILGYKINERFVIILVAGVVVGKWILPRVEESLATKAAGGEYGGGGAAGGGATAGAGGGSPGDVATGFHAGCARNANPGGNSPGWYTQGSNKEHLHHHCDWKNKCCFCTDVNKCLKSNTPPFRPGDCRPDWGTSGYLGGGPYPKTFSFNQCPPGTGP